jgi:putative ABC transport system permease protein
MIGNYLLIAIRNLRKHFSYSLINIAGLGLGLATCLLLSLWIRHELSYDTFHTKLDRTYRVSLEYSFGGQTARTPVSPTKVLPTLQKDFAEIETGARYYNPGSYRPYIVRNGDKMFEEAKFYFADSTFFDVFSFPLIQGNADHALTAPGSVVITQEMAKKYFGTTDALGKTLNINNFKDYTVTGVLAEIPANSLIKFDFVASFSSLDASKEQIWWSANYQTYVVVTPQANIAEVQDKFNVIVKEALGSEVNNAGDYVKYNFTPMKDIYLRSDLQEPELTGSIDYVYIFSGIAILILVIACINYVNLATARAADRAKEVGVRKVVGAVRQQLITQFIGESVVITSVAFVLALFVSSAALPVFNQLTDKEFTQAMVFEPGFLSIALLILATIALLSGLYPALVITGFKPVNILKGNFRTSGRGVWLRKSLVVFQFTISIILVIGTAVILKQVDYIQDKKLGYEKDNVLILPLDRKTGEVYTQLRTELMRKGSIENVARSSESPVRIKAGYSVSIPGSSNERGMITTASQIDENYISTLGMQMVSGRTFTENDFEKLTKDSIVSFVLNETAIKELYLEAETAIGTPIDMNGRKGEIVGVVKDFHFDSMHEKIRPLVLFTEADYNFMFVKLAAGNPQQAISDLKDAFTTLAPHRPFEYKFLNDRYTALYKSEQKMGAVCTAFATLAIVIACLGLLGLVAFAASQKTKEIGIRKVMGATAPGIVMLITKDFTMLVVASIVLGIPLSYYLMEQFWLVNFEYRTTIGPWPFVFAAVGCLVVSFATASYQAIKASLINPANTLRNE